MIWVVAILVSALIAGFVFVGRWRSSKNGGGIVADGGCVGSLNGGTDEQVGGAIEDKLVNA